jgi:hypothetical protein
VLARLTLADRTNALRAFGKATRASAAIVRASCPKPWVADVTDGRRVFLPGKTDYVHANGDGSKGVEVSFILWPGRLYEVCEPDPPGPALRYRCRVVNGSIVRI